MCKLAQGLSCVSKGQDGGVHRSSNSWPAAQEITQLLFLAGLGLPLPAETRNTSEGSVGEALTGLASSTSPMHRPHFKFRCSGHCLPPELLKPAHRILRKAK